MVADAHKSAETLKAEIIKSAEVEITKMRETAFKDIEERKEASMQEIKEEFVKQAAKIVEHKFAAELNNSNTDMIAVSAFKSVNSMEANS
jgi:F0F1-type ATP synthase membrane subunit b/b'